MKLEKKWRRDKNANRLTKILWQIVDFLFVFIMNPPKVLFLIIRIPQKKKKSNPREINTLSCSFTDPISPKLYVLSSLLKRLFIFQENTSKSDLFHFLRESKVFIFPVLVQTHQNREFEQKGIISNDIL